MIFYKKLSETIDLKFKTVEKSKLSASNSLNMTFLIYVTTDFFRIFITNCAREEFNNYAQNNTFTKNISDFL